METTKTDFCILVARSAGEAVAARDARLEVDALKERLSALEAERDNYAHDEKYWRETAKALEAERDRAKAEADLLALQLHEERDGNLAKYEEITRLRAERDGLRAQVEEKARTEYENAKLAGMVRGASTVGAANRVRIGEVSVLIAPEPVIQAERDAAWDEALEAVIEDARPLGIGAFWIERIRALKRGGK